RSAPARAPQSPLALVDVDGLVSDDDRAIRDTVRAFVDDRIKPDVADWYESGSLPARELARELGKLGVLGMHLEGYGCAGTCVRRGRLATTSRSSRTTATTSP
ncbi:MAG TPA: acyl-CoA dehydrogenase family protein, partial [Angustibacter sp.]|nr:acyl-CoA dehydrogenase family protein [Angustibacter sp.]